MRRTMRTATSATAVASFLAFSWIAPYEVTSDGRKISANGELVSANYFEALGVRPFAGHLLTGSDGHGPPALVVSLAFWKREMNSSPAAIGKVVTFGEQSDATHTGTAPATLFHRDWNRAAGIFRHQSR